MARANGRPAMKKPDPLPPLDRNKYYTDKYLAQRWDVHPVTPWKWVAAGILPPPVKIGPNTSRWSGAVIEAHEERQRAEAANRAQACADKRAEQVRDGAARGDGREPRGT
jgi:prophage regulatory protein